MDLASMITNAANELSTVFWIALWSIAALVGTFFTGGALMKMVRASKIPGQSTISFGDIVPILIIGGLLLNLSEFINTAWNSFGSGNITYGPISYDGAQDFGRFAAAINAVLTLASFAGGAFFFKGVLLLKKATVEGQGSQGSSDTVWRAMTHMVGGAALVQMPTVIDAFRQTFGLNW